jgi:hypothetical protein
MKHDGIEEAQNILIDLKNNLEVSRKIWLSLEKDNPHIDELSLEKWNKEARCWLHGATDLMESNELERWLFDHPPLSNTACGKATKYIKYWKEWLEIEPKGKPRYYTPDFDEFRLEDPLKNERLYEYLHRIAILKERKGKRDPLRWRALKSFLNYLRNLPTPEVAFIEQIFPEKMDVKGRIIRKIQPQVYPISVEIAGKILYKLAEIAINGRTNSQLTALEALGLCWMCLTASRLRQPTNIKMIEKVSPNNIIYRDDLVWPKMNVPTLFGEREITISNRLSKYLLALAKIPSKKLRKSILQSQRRVLERPLSQAIENCAIDPCLGKITWVTFLSPPHHANNNAR